MSTPPFPPPPPPHTRTQTHTHAHKHTHTHTHAHREVFVVAAVLKFRFKVIFLLETSQSSPFKTITCHAYLYHVQKLKCAIFEFLRNLRYVLLILVRRFRTYETNAPKIYLPGFKRTYTPIGLDREIPHLCDCSPSSYGVTEARHRQKIKQIKICGGSRTGRPACLK